MSKMPRYTIHCIIGFLLVFAVMSGSRELYFLFFLSLLFRVSMTVILNHNYKNMFIMYYTNANVIEAGESIKIEYKVTNTSFLPIAHTKIEFYLSEKLDTGSSLKEVAYFKNYQMINFSKEITCKYRGYYKLGKVRVEIFDPLMLSSKTIQFDKEIDLTVHPKTRKMEHLPLDTKDLHGTLKSNERTEEDRTNIINIRPFERGDQLKNVHWKLSAKLGELQTREFEQTQSARFFIILNGNKTQFDEGMTYSIEEEMVEYCASYAKMALENNVQTKLIATDKGNTHIEGNDSNDFLKFIEGLTGFESNGQQEFVSALQQTVQQNGLENTYYLMTYNIKSELLELLSKSKQTYKVAVFKPKSYFTSEALSLIEQARLDVIFVEKDVIFND